MPAKKAKTKTKINITIDTDLLERLRTVAQLREDSLSSVINHCLWEEIEQEEKILGIIENPVANYLLEQIGKSPSLLKTLAFAVQEEIDVDHMSEAIAKQTSLAKNRRAKKKQLEKKTPKGAKLSGA